MNPAGNTFTLQVAGLTPGHVYHVEAGTTLTNMAPLPGSEFTAGTATAGIPLPVSPATAPRRFFRLVHGPLP